MNKDSRKIIKGIAEAPAAVVDQTIAESQKAGQRIAGKEIKKAKEYWDILGPGLTTGASDDDPSGITTYSQAGAQYGFGLLWLAPYTLPMMTVVQEMCARIGIVTGRGLAANIRKHFPRGILLTTTVLLFVANTINIGADLGAMAKGTQLFAPKISFLFLLFSFAFLSLGLQIFTNYETYAKYLKWLSLILLSYVFSTISLGLPWREILLKYTLIPSLTLTKDGIFILCAFLGTTISPYLFFWQTSQEVEERVVNGNGKENMGVDGLVRKIKHMRLDVASGMFLSNLVTFFIVAASAGTLYTHGITNIKTASDAALALKPFAGNFSYFLFALGIIGSGLLAVPILAGSTAYALSESFGWSQGLDKKLRQARAFYGVIIISMIIGFLMNTIGIDVIKSLIWAAVLNGIVAPVVLVLIILISSNGAVMGKYVNHPSLTLAGWAVTAVMAVVGVATIISLF